MNAYQEIEVNDSMVRAKVFVEGRMFSDIEEIHGGYQYKYFDVDINEAVTVGPCIDFDALNRNREKKLSEYTFNWAFGDIDFSPITGIPSKSEKDNVN